MKGRARGAAIAGAALLLSGPTLGLILEGPEVDRVALASALMACGLVLLAPWCRARNWARRGRDFALVALTLVTLGSATSLVGFRDGSPHLRIPVHTWNQTHYLLGTKYFDELGYFELYNGLLLVDLEQDITKASKVRNLRTYKSHTRGEALSQARESGLRDRFTDARWSSFKSDAGVLFDDLGSGSRSSVLDDLGFNPSPAWLIVHEPLLQGVELKDRRSLEALGLLQVPLILASLGASWWAFGWRCTAWMLIWTGLFFGNRGRLVGGYFSYDWAALNLLGLSLLEKGRHVLATPFVAWSGLMRGFTGMVALGPVTRALWTALPGQERDRRAWAFCVALGVSMVAVVGLSFTASGGPGAWADWSQKIELHSERISAGGRRIGLTSLFGEDYSESGPTEKMDERRALVEERKVPLRLVQIGLLGLLAVALRKRSLVDGAILGLGASFVLMVVSRYYFAAWAVWLLLGRSRDRPEGAWLPRLALFGLVVAFCFTRLVDGTPWSDSYQARYQLVNAWVLGMVLLVLGAAIWQDRGEQARA